jgi:hypothetical protein
MEKSKQMERQHKAQEQAHRARQPGHAEREREGDGKGPQEGKA